MSELVEWRTLDEQAPLVDVSLIDAMLALSIEERLRLNDRMIQTVQQLREAFRAADVRSADVPRE